MIVIAEVVRVDRLQESDRHPVREVARLARVDVAERRLLGAAVRLQVDRVGLAGVAATATARPGISRRTRQSIMNCRRLVSNCPKARCMGGLSYAGST